MKAIRMFFLLALVFVGIGACNARPVPDLTETTRMIETSILTDTSLITRETQNITIEELKAIFLRGNAVQDDMQALYDKEKELLKEIVEQIRLTDGNFCAAGFFDEKVGFAYRNNNLVFSCARLEELIAKLLDIVGLKQGPTIINSDRQELIQFWINAPDYGNPYYRRIKIIYSPDLVLLDWTRLEDDWYIYTETIAG